MTMTTARVLNETKAYKIAQICEDSICDALDELELHAIGRSEHANGKVTYSFEDGSTLAVVPDDECHVAMYEI